MVCLQFHTNLDFPSFSCLCPCALKKYIPAIKEQWVVVKESVEPHVKSLSTKTVEVYETSKSTLAPHVLKAQEVVDPYFQVSILSYTLFSFRGCGFSVLPTCILQLYFWVTGSKKVQQAICWSSGDCSKTPCWQSSSCIEALYKEGSSCLREVSQICVNVPSSGIGINLGKPSFIMLLLDTY